MPNNIYIDLLNKMCIRRGKMKRKVRMWTCILMVVGIAITGALGLVSCGGGGSGGGGGPVYILGDVTKGDPTGTPPNDVHAGVIVASSVNFISDITDATVSVNNKVLDFFIFAYALLTSPPAVDVGDSVTLKVVHGDNTATSTLTVPEKPVITAPTTGSFHDATSAINVTWNSASTAPDGIYVFVDGTYTQSSSDYYSNTLVGLATSHSIPLNTLLAGKSDIPIEVYFVNFTNSFTGDVISGSTYEVEHLAQVSINTY